MLLKTKFQDEDFELGEIVDATIMYRYNDRIEVMTDKHYYFYDSIKELTEDWEDYKEPKEYYYLDSDGEILSDTDFCDVFDGKCKEIGNYFETKEEAEKVVEKLKAWKRLKERGFRFEGIKEDYTRILQSQVPSRTGKRYLQFNKSEDEEWMKENWGYLDLLFGGEE